MSLVRNDFVWSRHLLLFLFHKGENQVRTKKPLIDSSKEKVVCKTRLLGPRIRLLIGKVSFARWHPSKLGTWSLLMNLVHWSTWVKDRLVTQAKQMT